MPTTIWTRDDLDRTHLVYEHKKSIPAGPSGIMIDGVRYYTDAAGQPLDVVRHGFRNPVTGQLLHRS